MKVLEEVMRLAVEEQEAELNRLRAERELAKQIADSLEEMIALWADESEFPNEVEAAARARAAVDAYRKATA